MSRENLPDGLSRLSIMKIAMVLAGCGLLAGMSFAAPAESAVSATPANEARTTTTALKKKKKKHYWDCGKVYIPFWCDHKDKDDVWLNDEGTVVDDDNVCTAPDGHLIECVHVEKGDD